MMIRTVMTRLLNNLVGGRRYVLVNSVRCCRVGFDEAQPPGTRHRPYGMVYFESGLINLNLLFASTRNLYPDLAITLPQPGFWL